MRLPVPVVYLTIELAELDWGNSTAEFYGELLPSGSGHGGENLLVNLPSIGGELPAMPPSAGNATEAVHAPQIPGTGVLHMAGTRFRIPAGLKMNWRTLEPNQKLKKSR